MEKLKSGKKVVDSDNINNNNNDTSATNSSEVPATNNSAENYRTSSVVTRSGFRTSTLAKRARVSITSNHHHSKSDKRSAVNKSSSSSSSSVNCTRDDQEQSNSANANKSGGCEQTVFKQESSVSNHVETVPSTTSTTITKVEVEEEEGGGGGDSNENSMGNNKHLANHAKEVVTSKSNWNLTKSDDKASSPAPAAAEEEEEKVEGNGVAAMARELKSRSSSSPQPQQQLTTVSIKSEKKKSPCSSTRSSPNVVESAANNNNNNGHGSRHNKGKGVVKPHAPEKTNLAPMLLMNNLPYMGELTFDTRPRRGRKPKKADICHLISKNYGIQFPNSYVNIPVSSPTPPRVSTLTTTTSTSTGGTKSAKNKSSARNSRNNNNNNNNGSPKSSSNVNTTTTTTSSSLNSGPGFIPAINWNSQLPPDLLPLASLNPSVFLYPKNAAAVAAAAAVNNNNNNYNNLNNNKKISSSSSSPMFQPLQHYHQHLQQQQQQVHEQLQQFSKHFQQQQLLCDDRQSPDEPLNLCVRDEDSSVAHHLKQLNLLNSAAAAAAAAAAATTTNSAAAIPLNLNLNQSCVPTTTKPSATNLFNNFNLKRCSSGGNNNNNKNFTSSMYHGRSSASSSLGGGGLNNNNNNGGRDRGSNKNTVNNHNNNNNPVVVSDDPNLVNINLQLNLSASKLANYVNSANNNRPMTLGGTTTTTSATRTNCISSASDCGGGGGGRNSPAMNSLSVGPPLSGIGGGKSPKSRRKRSAAVYRPLNNTSGMPGSVSGSHPQFNNNNSNNSSMVNHHQHGLQQSANSLDSNSSGHNKFPAEVSICKFKFTGGAKPSLQEKKMLSVDSTGNFRFYSDKACTSAQSKNLNNLHHHHQGSLKDEFSHCGEIVSAQGLPKSAKSMSMCMPLPIPTMSTCSMLSEIHTPSLPCSIMSPSELDCSSSNSDGATSSSMVASPTGSGGGGGGSSGGLYQDSTSTAASAAAGSAANKMTMKRKRRTRKSLMREKLEKTFKEKGFLIQTQQLESAQGATYCKFRQLKKFTRYLFRSWKDYLPDNLKAINPQAAGQAAANNTNEPSPLLQPPSSDLSESMEMDDHDKADTEDGSETPDNMSLSPTDPNHHHNDDDDDPQEEEEEEEEEADLDES